MIGWRSIHIAGVLLIGAERVLRHAS